MKYLVFSDSHGSLSTMETAIEKEKCDGVIHLGDGYSDAGEIENFYPGMAMIKMPGNCDFIYGVPYAKNIFVEGVRIFMTHGHHSGVKDGYAVLRMQARDNAATVALFGHTHIPHLEDDDGILLLNPGSAASGHYAILDLHDGRATAELKEI